MTKKVKIFTDGCKDCKKCIDFLKYQKVELEECWINKITKEDIYDMLSKSMEGIPEIRYLSSELENMTLSKAVDEMLRTKGLVDHFFKHPITVSEDFIYAGKDRDELRAFVPREVKKFSNSQFLKMEPSKIIKISKLPNAEFKAKLEERIKIGEKVEFMLSQDEETNLNKISKKLGLSWYHVNRSRRSIEANKEMLKMYFGE